ncbi:lanthionine synthetase C family protein [Fodinicola feengrottensis]|uniref:Lanthionine synthetase C family protein n=2 Tax=Fodinicola feengrottensis TaxID=435914 RepID=A0ABP4SA14_9ACTN
MSTDRAASVVAAIAAKLADPAAVAALASRADNGPVVRGRRQPPWSSLSLSCGNPAIALLFAELAVAEPKYRQPTHSYLSAGLIDPQWATDAGLFGGMGSLAFAAHAASLAYGGYSRLLGQFDDQIAAGVGDWARRAQSRVEAGGPIQTWTYDVISGFSGIGRYLLSRYEETGDPVTFAALTELIEALVAVAMTDVRVGGHLVPAWWVSHDRHRQLDGGAEHLNFGLAHGIAGPLALLSISWLHDVRVPRQDEAIDRIVALLDRWQTVDTAGPYWPHTLSLADFRSGSAVPRSRDVWCYGAAGIARARSLAAAAAESPRWREWADRALTAALRTSVGRVTDYGLCHGWAGLLRVATVMGFPETECRPLVDLICDAYEEKLTFGLPPVAGVDRPGFLEGAAGVGLALQGFVSGGAAPSGWDAALLLT